MHMAVKFSNISQHGQIMQILEPTLAGHLLDRGTRIVQHMLKTQSKGRREEIREGKETKSPLSPFH
jgi:hypothetical protein